MISWRTNDEPSFVPKNRISVDVGEVDQWQNLKATLDDASEIVHVRVQFLGGVTLLKSLQLELASGKTLTLLK